MSGCSESMRPGTGWVLLIAVLTACGGDAAKPVQPDQPKLFSIEVQATSPLTWIGATRQLTATARDAAGGVVSGTSFAWTTSAAGVATVNASTGSVTAIANGTATISATSGNITGSTTITVQQAPALVVVTRALDTILAANQTKTFTAQVRDSGNTLITGAVVRWTSANTAVATIDSVTGVATATGAGTVAITARSGPATHNASLVVRNGVLVGGRVLLTDYGNVTDNNYLVDDYFVVWWYKAGANYASAAQQILTWLKSVKTDALALGLRHPPSDARGTYLNIYIHEPGPGNDNYPDGWGAGVGTDGNGLPFMSVGSSQRTDPLLFRHEGFHLYQYDHTSRSYDYTGDGQWFNEASASWFAELAFPTEDYSHLGAATVPWNPHLAMWLGWVNIPSGDPSNWNRTTRQYALSSWLNYLTTTAGAPVSVLVDGYNAGTSLLPQEYINTRVTGMGATFADWAAASTPDMSYLTRPQWTRAMQDAAAYGDPSDWHPYVLEYTDAGTNGALVAPPQGLKPHGWSYNVVHVRSTQAANWRFEIHGSPTGSGGAAAVFQARLVSVSGGVRSVNSVLLANGLDGSLNVNTTATGTDLYLIVAAVPPRFSGQETYSYQVKVERSP